MVPELTGILSTSLWNRIILQACHSELYVREAVTALAALVLSLSQTYNGSPAELSHPHYAFALHEYGSAIRNMRRALSSANQENSTRKALMGCVLVFCFEAFQGNKELAIAHAKSGYELQQVWQARISSRSNSSPSGSAIEDDLLQTIYRIDLQIMTIDASRPHDLHRKASIEGADAVAGMPARFSDLNEAHRYWVLIMRRNHHFVHSALTAARHGRSNVLYDRPEGRLGDIGALIHSHYPSERFFTLDEHASYSGEIERWQRAFRPFLNMPDGSTHPGAALLHIHSLSSQANLDMLVTKREDFGDYTDKFREIIALARVVVGTAVSAKCGRLSINIDLGIIPSLLVVIYLCQDEAVREEARSLLRSSDRREGIWTTKDFS